MYFLADSDDLQMDENLGKKVYQILSYQISQLIFFARVCSDVSDFKKKKPIFD